MLVRNTDGAITNINVEQQLGNNSSWRLQVGVSGYRLRLHLSCLRGHSSRSLTCGIPLVQIMTTCLDAMYVLMVILLSNVDVKKRMFLFNGSSIASGLRRFAFIYSFA